MNKTYYFWIKLYKNEAELIDLKSGKVIRKKAAEEFSSNRQVVADFEKTLNFLKSLSAESFGVKTGFPYFNHLKIAFQQMELNEGGLSSIEMRALSDLGANLGSKKTWIVNSQNNFSNEEITNQIILEGLRS